MKDLKNDLVKIINNKIENNKIKMKPKIYFILKSFLVISFILIIFLACLYIGNFILLIFHEHKQVIDSLNLNPFDVKKIFDFFKIIPGLLIILLLVFVLSLYKLIKDFAFVYRKNILYIILFLFLILMLTVVNIHIFLDKDFNKIKFGERGEFPGFIYLHKYYREDHIPKNFPPIFKRDINLKKESLDR